MAIARVRPGSSAYRYYFKSVVVGDGGRERGVPLRVGQELAGVPAGEWTGSGAPLLGLSGVVTEAEMEALFGRGLHPHPEILAQFQLPCANFEGSLGSHMGSACCSWRRVPQQEQVLDDEQSQNPKNDQSCA